MPFQVFLNGLGSGSSLQRLLNSGMDPCVLRPWVETDRWGNPTGRNYITVAMRNPDGTIMTNSQNQVMTRNILTNATATLRREDWLRIDEAVSFAAKPRLRFWADLYGTNPYDVQNGLAVPSIQHAVAVGAATATISMDPIRKGERSRPTLDTAQIPLPVIHSDGSFSLREISVSRNGAMPLDTTNIQLSARAVAENVEQLAIGTASSYTYAGGTVYGLTNFPSRFTKTMTTPTGTNGGTTLSELLDMIKTLQDNFYYGPYVAYYSSGWNKWFASDYAAAYPGSLRGRIIDGVPEIVRWQQLDYLTGYQIILVQMTPDVAQGIQGMPITTVQWEEQGGFEQCFKVLCIQIPRFRADGLTKTGINHGTAP